MIDAGTAASVYNIGSFPVSTTSLTAAVPPGQVFFRVRAVNGCGSSAPSTQASFIMPSMTNPLLPGTYVGTIANNTRAALGRPPISSFQLTLNQPLPTSGSTPLSALWVDNVGCRHSRIFGGVGGAIFLNMESLFCGDGDFRLSITSINGGVVQGQCNGGASCRFQMVRQ